MNTCRSWNPTCTDSTHVSECGPFHKGAVGNTDVRGVDLGSVWESGCMDAVSILRDHPVYGADGLDISRASFGQLQGEGVTMLRPYG